jgi:very-short-patch-repair endonuclease
MGATTVQRSSAAAWALARRQHWVITRAQLMERGFSERAIKHRVRTGRLHPLHRGVYAVGHPEPTRPRLFMAAVLRCGQGALLSHESAAELWQIRRARGERIDVAVPVERCPRGSAVRVHRRPLLDGEASLHMRIPVTSPAFTIVDLATRVYLDELEAAINEADIRGVATPAEIRAALDRMGTRPGVRVVRELLDRRTFRMSRSQLERRLRPIARRAGLPEPETCVYVNGREVDFYFRELGFVIEADGGTFHRTPMQQREDRRRDQAHLAAGTTAIRFTHGQIRYEPAYVEETLAAVRRRLLGGS